MNQVWWLKSLSSSRKEMVQLFAEKVLPLGQKREHRSRKSMWPNVWKNTYLDSVFSVWFLLQGWDGTKQQLQPTFSFRSCLKIRGSNLENIQRTFPSLPSPDKALTSPLASTHQSPLMKPLSLEGKGGGVKPVVSPEWRNNCTFNKNATLLLSWLPWIVKKKKDSLYI